MGATDTIFYIAVLVMSVVVHEVSHGFAAEYFGDHTARFAGRLTLNPLKHLDPFGSVILPALLVFIQSPFLIGWAKPVPYNPDNLSDKKKGELWVAAAGVLSNLFLALLFGLIMRFGIQMQLSQELLHIVSLIVMVNLSLAIFNLVPIPPLDGSKILFSLLPASMYGFIEFMEQYSLFILILFIVAFSKYLFPIFALLFQLITGVSLLGALGA